MINAVLALVENQAYEYVHCTRLYLVTYCSGGVIYPYPRHETSVGKSEHLFFMMYIITSYCRLHDKD